MRVISAKNVTDYTRKHYGSKIEVVLQDESGKLRRSEIDVWLPYGEAVDEGEETCDDHYIDNHYASKLEVEVVGKIINAIVQERYI